MCNYFITFVAYEGYKTTTEMQFPNTTWNERRIYGYSNNFPASKNKLACRPSANVQLPSSLPVFIEEMWRTVLFDFKTIDYSTDVTTHIYEMREGMW